MMVRIRPDNYDNWGSLGRPYLDATRAVWRQLTMTERDLVVRRHTRAPQRLVHVLEGADKPTLDAYENSTKAKQGLVQTAFFLNRQGRVTAVQGDAPLHDTANRIHPPQTIFNGQHPPN